MSITVEAVYEDGVLKPKQPLPLEEHARVRIIVEHPETGWAQRTHGLIPWNGDVETLDRFALDPDLEYEQ